MKCLDKQEVINGRQQFQQLSRTRPTNASPNVAVEARAEEETLCLHCILSVAPAERHTLRLTEKGALRLPARDHWPLTVRASPMITRLFLGWLLYSTVPSSQLPTVSTQLLQLKSPHFFSN